MLSKGGRIVNISVKERWELVLVVLVVLVHVVLSIGLSQFGSGGVY